LLERVVTFGVSTCSFSLMFTKSAESICIAHIDSKAPIPMGLMANKLSFVDRVEKLRIIASITSDKREFNKFDKKNAFRHLPSVLGMILPRCHIIQEADGDEALGGFGHDEIGLFFPGNMSLPRLEGIYGPDKMGGGLYSRLLPMDIFLRLQKIGQPTTVPNESDIKFAKEVLNALATGRYGFTRLHIEVITNISKKATTDYNDSFIAPTLLKHQKSQERWTIAHIIGNFLTTPSSNHEYFHIFNDALCKYRGTFSLPLSADLHDALRDAGVEW
jgi:hypothetical protein